MHLVATFDEIGDLRPRAQVVIRGVKVGTVQTIRLDPDFRAEVVMEVNSALELTDEANAAIETSGLLGDQYITLDPGGGDRVLKDGESDHVHSERGRAPAPDRPLRSELRRR